MRKKTKLPFRRRSLLLLNFIIFFFASCKKESVVNSTEKINITKNEEFIPEKVNSDLLSRYIAYQTKVEANAILKKAGQNTDSVSLKMDRKDFDLMINNYLANERNMILSKAYTLKKSTPVRNAFNNDDGNSWPPTDPVDEDDPNNTGGPFTGTGNFPGSTVSGIVFSGNVSNKGVISQQGFSFSGVHGTIAPVGGLSQSVYNGVTTYQQNFSETYTFPGGIVYTQNFVVYGNIYGSTVTVNAMQIPH